MMITMMMMMMMMMMIRRSVVDKDKGRKAAERKKEVRTCSDRDSSLS